MNTEQEFFAPSVVDDGMTSMSMLSDDKTMDRMIRFAEIMATGKATIPNELRNVGDCLAITMQAVNWKMNPFAVAQKMFFISGKIGYEAQLVSAAISNSGAVKDIFKFEWYGPWEKVIGKFEIKKGDKGEYRVPGWKLADEEGIGIRVWATLRSEDEPRVLDLLLAQARTRNSTLWADDPKQQLAYLAQKRWARLYAPGVILGVYTPDELMPVPEKEINPMPEAGPSKGNGKPPIDQPTTPYPEERFKANLDSWTKVIREGMKTADDVINSVHKRTPTTPLTEQQKTELRAIKPFATQEDLDELATKAEAAGITFDEICNGIGVDSETVFDTDMISKAYAFIENPAGN